MKVQPITAFLDLLVFIGAREVYNDFTALQDENEVLHAKMIC